ncbi:MFS transporter, partial [Polaribacter sp.]|uniref:MFS transporter n=1 Tax=Polaribacter sp. TaxID=1920175 RepID=UPI00404768F4
IVAFLYALSALLSAVANSYELLYIARMIGGLAFGAALVLAPMYIAEISTSKNRGKLVAIQQLNIVLGFFAAFLSNYLFNKYNTPDSSFLTDENVWRYMLGVELIPALLYFFFLFFVPKSPRWLYVKNKPEEAKQVLIQIHGKITADEEIAAIEKNSSHELTKSKVSFKELLKPGLKFLFLVGLVIGILQQITGINAVYFYATSIFKQTGIGTDAAFSSGILLSSVSVIFTIISMYLIDKTGRRSLLLVGTFGIAFSLILCAYGFQKATYQLTTEKINSLNFVDSSKLLSIENTVFTNDLDFKNAAKSALGLAVYQKNDGAILEAATNINATLVLIGILGFIACFAFSLGPVMWV